MRRFIALCLLCAAATTAGAATLTGVVIVVIDGDTLLFKPDSYGSASRAFMKVRLVDIDAPEKNQPHGEAATQALKTLALKRQAQLETVATDRYGRTLGHLRVEGVSVNAELVRDGHAWASDRARASLRSLQDAASRARVGLWADAAPTPPWQWRRQSPPSF